MEIRHTPMRRRPPGRMVAVLTVGMLVATACGGGGSNGDEGGDPDDAAASPSDDTTATDVLDGPRWANVVRGPQASDAEPVRGGRITVALEGEANTYLPSRWQGGVGFNAPFAIYDPLMTRDANDELRPYLAESIEPNEDFTAWTLTLRPGVRFHDGTALNAEAMKRLWDDYLTVEGTVTADAAEIVDRMEIVDDLTVTYVLDESWPPFPELLELPLGWPFSPDAADDLGDAFGDQPVGTGPFEVVRWERDNELVLRRNDDYWQEGRPYLDEIVFRPIPDEATRTAALASGDIDALQSRLLTSLPADLTNLDEVTVVLGVGNIGEVAVFNTTRPPTDDRRVRQALVHAVDQAALVRVSAGEAAELSELRTQFFPQDSPFYSEAVAEAWPDHDAERAEELLEDYVNDPGRSDGKGVGEPVEVTLNSSNAPNVVEVATAYQGFYEDVGFEVDLQPLESTTPALLEGDFHVQLTRKGDNRSPLGEFLFYFEAPDIVSNFTNFHDDTIADILDRMRTAATVDEQAALAEEMGLHLADEVPFQWTGSNLTLIAAKDNVQGLRSWTFPDGSLGDGVVPGVAFWGQVWLAE